MTERRHHRPRLPGAQHFESIEGDVDPAMLSEAADRAATALVRGARDQADEALVERVVHLADSEGLETLAELWSGAAADSLAGARLAPVPAPQLGVRRPADRRRRVRPRPAARAGRRGHLRRGRAAGPRRGPGAGRRGARRRGGGRLRRHAVPRLRVRPGGCGRTGAPRPRGDGRARRRTPRTCLPRACSPWPTSSSAQPTWSSPARWAERLCRQIVDQRLVESCLRRAAAAPGPK